MPREVSDTPMELRGENSPDSDAWNPVNAARNSDAGSQDIDELSYFAQPPGKIQPSPGLFASAVSINTSQTA